MPRFILCEKSFVNFRKKWRQTLTGRGGFRSISSRCYFLFYLQTYCRNFFNLNKFFCVILWFLARSRRGGGSGVGCTSNTSTATTDRSAPTSSTSIAKQLTHCFTWFLEKLSFPFGRIWPFLFLKWKNTSHLNTVVQWIQNFVIRINKILCNTGSYA